MLKISKVIEYASIPEAIETLEIKLKEYEFGVLSTMEMHKILKEKVGADIEPYYILKVCNPKYAEQMLQLDRSVGMYLPCSIVLRELEAKHKIEVEILHVPNLLSQLNNSGIEKIAFEIQTIFEKIIINL